MDNTSSTSGVVGEMINRVFVLRVQLSSSRKEHPFNSRTHGGIQARAIYIWCISLCTLHSTFWGIHRTLCYTFALFLIRICSWGNESIHVIIIGAAWRRICTGEECQWIKFRHSRQCPAARPPPAHSLGGCRWWLPDSFSAPIRNRYFIIYRTRTITASMYKLRSSAS